MKARKTTFLVTAAIAFGANLLPAPKAVAADEKASHASANARFIRDSSAPSKSGSIRPASDIRDVVARETLPTEPIKER